jgi:RHS repeat-associated protein
MVIKVMAGDKVDIFGRSYHTNYSGVSNSNSTPLSILQIMSGLISSPSNVISGKGVSASQLESWNSGLLPSTFIRGQNYESGTTIPKAYINYIFLDEQFRYVTGNASRVGSSGSVKQHWSDGLSNISVPKNGYLLVYVSNESNFTVFFDNLQVVHKPGPIVEETHYYPFGLVMNGISSKGLSGVVDNKKKYNGIEQNTDFDLNLYDAFFRNLDPQIGKWWQVDPKIDGQEMWSPYNAMSDNPILHSDPLGDTSILSNQFKTLKQGWDDFNQGKGPAY